MARSGGNVPVSSWNVPEFEPTFSESGFFLEEYGNSSSPLLRFRP